MIDTYEKLGIVLISLALVIILNHLANQKPEINRIKGGLKQ
jgi:hypothetical protein